MSYAKEKTALVLILHGSPYAESSAPVAGMIDSLQKRTGFAHVMLAFLECNAPGIGEAIQTCAALGMSKVIAVPYFLHTGRHLVMDIPKLLADAADRHPHLEVQITEPVATFEGTTRALNHRARECD